MSDPNPTVSEIFNDLVEIVDARSRDAALRAACGANTALRLRVESLLEAHNAAAGFLGGVGNTVDKSAEAIAVPAPGRESKDLTASRRFGDYELGEALGRGGMGVVYKATQTRLRRTVALKMILESETASPTARRRFTLEAEAAAKLNHSNIVPIYEVGEHGGHPFLSMKFIAGENLRKRIASGDLCLTPKGVDASRMDIRDRVIAIARLVATVARAVQHAHENGVLHRDLKPGNIIVDPDGEPHLTDFGLAKLLEPQGAGSTPVPLTVSGVTLGTPSYMSPEQAAGLRLSVGSDVYSLGAILYEMLAGRPPFQAGTLLETLRLAAEQEAKPPSTINPRIVRDLDTICVKCLEKNPAARYPSAEAVAEDLDRWLRHEPIHARPASVLLRGSRWTRRNRAVAALILALCAGLATALVLLQMVNKEKLATGIALKAKEQALRDERAALGDAERQGQALRQQLRRRLDLLGLHPDRGYPEVITSEDRASFMSAHVLPPSSVTNRYRVGIYSRQTPTDMMDQFAPILDYLEKHLVSEPGESVRLDLVIYGTYEPGIEALLIGEVDFMRLGPASYVIARARNPAVPLIVAQTYKSVFRGAIFTAYESGITNLAGLKGRGRFAFGDRYSTSGNYLSKGALLDAGLTGKSFSGGWTNLQNHSSVLTAVAEGRFVGGAGNASGIERKHEELIREGKPGLRILERFEEPGTPWVARPAMPGPAVARLRTQLLLLKDPRLLTAFKDDVTGFREASSADFDELQQSMEKARQFEIR